MPKQFSIFMALVLFNSFAVFSQPSIQKSTGLYINGKEFHIGMTEQSALAELSDCCELSPPAAKSTNNPSGGYFVLPKNPPQTIIGAIWFRDQKVVSVSRELADNVDTSSDDLVAFMRAFKRTLPDGVTSAIVGVKHEQASNAETDVITLSLSNGHSIVIRIGTLDKEANSKRDFVTIDEVIGSAE